MKPYIVTLAEPDVGEFILLMNVIAGLSYEKAMKLVPIRLAIVAGVVFATPVPSGVRQTRVVSDLHDVVLHSVFPTRATALFDVVPKLAPMSVRS